MTTYPVIVADIYNVVVLQWDFIALHESSQFLEPLKVGGGFGNQNTQSYAHQQ